MRKEVDNLIGFGPMPTEDSVDVDTVDKYENLLSQIKPPLSNDEAEALANMFGQDSFFGLAWTLINLIESAPGWPLGITLPSSNNEWIMILKNRAKRHS